MSEYKEFLEKKLNEAPERVPFNSFPDIAKKKLTKIKSYIKDGFPFAGTIRAYLKVSSGNTLLAFNKKELSDILNIDGFSALTIDKDPFITVNLK